MAQAAKDREANEKSRVISRLGCRQAKPDRKVVQSEPRDLRRDPVSGVSGEILRSRKLVERSGREPRPGKPTSKARLETRQDQVNR